MTPDDAQIALEFSKAADLSDDDRWLGMVIDHRNLFEALSDGWLRPPRHRTGLLVGIGSYTSEHGEEPYRNRIPGPSQTQIQGPTHVGCGRTSRRASG